MLPAVRLMALFSEIIATMLSLRRLLRRPFSVKVFESSIDALEDIRNGSRIAIGGYGSCGIPENLIRALDMLGPYDLTVYSATTGQAGWGLDLLLQDKQVRRLITSYAGVNLSFDKQYHSGEMELELVPEGSLAAKLYAGGAGIPAFYTKTGVGTVIEDGLFPIKYTKGNKKSIEIYSHGKEKRSFHGRDHLLEEAIITDYSLIKAWKADTMGNLVFRRTAANFNTVMAQCARVTVAEVEEIVPSGALDPDDIHVPAVYVHRLVKGEYYEKRLGTITNVRSGKTAKDVKKAAEREKIARRAAKEVSEGMYVHLGVGIPGLVAQFLDPNLRIMVHSDSGALGIGKYPEPGKEDSDIVNSGREPATLVPGAACFSSNDAMDIVRGSHLDLIVTGAFQVSQRGDLANWVIPGQYSAGIGASMDIVAGDRTRTIVTMRHMSNGNKKLLSDCTLPLTGRRCVDVLITEMGVFDFTRENTMTLVELSRDYKVSDVKEVTGCRFEIASDLKCMEDA